MGGVDDILLSLKSTLDDLQTAKTSLFNTINLETNVKENTWMWSEDKELQSKIQFRISEVTALSAHLGALKRLTTDPSDWSEDASRGPTAQRWLEDCNKYKSEFDKIKKEIEAESLEIADGLKLLEESDLDEKFEEFCKKQKQLIALQKEAKVTSGLFPVLEKNQTYEDVINKIEHDVEILRSQTESCIQKCNSMEKFSRKEYCDSMDAVNKALLQKLEQEKLKNEETIKRQTELCNFYSTLSGYKIISESNCKTVLELLDVNNQEKPDTGDKVIVRLIYNLQRPPNPKVLTDIQFDNCPVATADIVEMALKMNDISIALQILIERINNTQHLVNEIKALREMYAIDWLPNERMLLLMAGKYVGHIEVMDHANYKLTNVKGPQTVNVEELNDSSKEMSLTAFVKNLEEHFTSI